MKLVLALFISLTSLNVMAQNSHDEIIQRFLKEREKMMKDIMKAFDDDEFFQDDFFKDDMFEALKKHGLGGFKGFSGAGDNIEVEEKMESDGTISVIITPKTKDSELNIETTENVISIKSEVKVKEESTQGGSSSQSISVRSFNRSIAIPQGFKAQAPKKQGDSIVITLVPVKKDVFQPRKDGKVPVKKAPGE
ncbi:MAG: Hsp20 family protein, partial [Bacteriovoracaceae bacterium]|nr:Hsp20 family protein [Bacteriovoracaceae bacterium]